MARILLDHLSLTRRAESNTATRAICISSDHTFGMENCSHRPVVGQPVVACVVLDLLQALTTPKNAVTPCWGTLLFSKRTVEAPVVLIGVGVVLVGGRERDQPFLPTVEMPTRRELDQ